MAAWSCLFCLYFISVSPAAFLLDNLTEKEIIMNAIDYKKGGQTRLIAWKAKMRNLTFNAESHGYKKEEKVLPNNQGLNMPITEMSSRSEQQKKERPIEATPLRKNIDNGTTDMRGKYVLRSRLSWTGLYGKEPWPRERKLWEKL